MPVEEAVGLDGALDPVAAGEVDEQGEGGVVDPAGKLPEPHAYLDLTHPSEDAGILIFKSTTPPSVRRKGNLAVIIF